MRAYGGTKGRKDERTKEQADAPAHRPIVHSSFPPTVLLLALLPFVLNLGAYFLSDDFVLLGWTHVHSVGGVLGFFDPGTFWFYRPIVKVYYWVGESIFGLHPLPFHLFSLLLHGANGYLVYRLVARQMKTALGVGLAAALIFMLVPYHAETVSWIAATGDLTAVFCMLAGLMLFQRFWEYGGGLYLAGSLAVFALGLLTRETTLMLPVLVALDIAVLESSDGNKESRPLAGRSPIARVIGVLCAYAAVLLAYVVVQWGSRAGGGVGRGGLEMHALNVDSILLGIMEYVHGLVPGGSLLAHLPLDVLRVLVWVEAGIGLLLIFLLWRARQHLTLFGLVWMLVTPLIFVFFSPPADRYFYLPSVGYAIFVASLLGGLVRWTESRWKLSRFSLAKAVAVVILCGLLLSETVSLSAKQNLWRTAGQVSGGVFFDVQQAAPDLHDYSAFYFVDLPVSVNGVPLFGNGLQQGLQLVYDNDTLAASVVTCEYLRAQPELPRYTYIFRFKGDGVLRLNAVGECP